MGFCPVEGEGERCPVGGEDDGLCSAGRGGRRPALSHGDERRLSPADTWYRSVSGVPASGVGSPGLLSGSA